MNVRAVTGRLALVRRQDRLLASLRLGLVLLAGCSVAEAPRCPSVYSPPCTAAAASSSASAEPPPVAAPPGPLTSAFAETASKIQAHASTKHDAFERLRVLTDTIGHRLSGTPQLDRAIEWAKREFEKDAQENVHTEQVMVPHWKRGVERGYLFATASQEVKVLGLGGTVPTPKGGITAKVIVVASFEELEQRASEVKGAIVLYNVPMPAFDEEKGSGYGGVAKFRAEGPSRAAKLGAKAVLMRSVTAHSLSTLHTGALRYAKDVEKIPAAAITTESADLLARLVTHGEQVRFKLELESQTLTDAPSANVIAEIVGREKPDELVLIGAHLDSWDLGQGAHDDGAGCVMLMQALADLRKLGLRPRRTIRAVLFTNEENGLKGALAYGEAHKDELPKIVAAFEADIGGFAPRGLTVETAKEKHPVILPRVQDLMQLMAPLGASRVIPEFSGADLIPLTKAGVLGLGLLTDHRRYFDIHHTEADTLDKVDPDDLAKNAAFVATLAYVIADAEERLDRP